MKDELTPQQKRVLAIIAKNGSIPISERVHNDTVCRTNTANSLIKLGKAVRIGHSLYFPSAAGNKA